MKRASSGLANTRSKGETPKVPKRHGEWKDHDMNGQGMYIYSDGATYEGEWKRHGRGKQTWSIGIQKFTYEGEWKDNNRHGQGKQTSSHGDVYEGEWKDDSLNGQGKKINSEGDVHEGEFKNDKLNGQGKKTNSDRYVYEGEFKDDMLNGQGKKTCSHGDVYRARYVYEGKFKDDMLHGQGKQTFLNGSTYEGEFKGNLLNGQGKKTHSCGEVYEGEFKDDMLNGQGKKTNSCGDVCEGEFKGDVLNGQGKLTCSDGSTYEGEFQDGRFCRKAGRKHILSVSMFTSFNENIKSERMIIMLLEVNGESKGHKQMLSVPKKMVRGAWCYKKNKYTGMITGPRQNLLDSMERPIRDGQIPTGTDLFYFIGKILHDEMDETLLSKEGLAVREEWFQKHNDGSSSRDDFGFNKGHQGGSPDEEIVASQADAVNTTEDVATLPNPRAGDGPSGEVQTQWASEKQGLENTISELKQQNTGLTTANQRLSVKLKEETERREKRERQD